MWYVSCHAWWKSCESFHPYEICLVVMLHLVNSEFCCPLGYFFLPTSEKVFLVWLYTLTLGQREINSWITNVHLYLLICWCYYFFFFIVIFFFLEGWKSVLIYLLELIVIGLHQMLRSKVFQLLVVLMEQVLARWERKFVLLNPWNYCNSELVFYSGFLT